MISIKKFVVYTVLALGAVVFWCHTHSDRAKIARLFDSAAKIAERSPDESVMEGAVKAKALAAFFGSTCRFKVPEARLSGPVSNANLSGMILAFRHDVPRFSVSFSDLDITVDVLTAHVEGHVRIDGADGFLKTKIRDARPFAAELEKNDGGEWKIVAVTLLKYSNT